MCDQCVHASEVEKLIDLSMCASVQDRTPQNDHPQRRFEFDITFDLVQKQKKSMFKDQHFMDIEVANELAQAYRDKDLNPIGKYYTPTIDLERNWGTDVIQFIREINDSLQEDTLVFLTDRQKYVYDKIQALPKGIDSIGLMIANNTVIDDESQNQTMLCTP
ncbi:MAG: hypothetical protein EZS28_033035 [Streblomastix strix]|uniref:Uncharacterized protein n=1 Tax=Streblomastix strix TaxID=222440 RepID=A0A5J4ULQ6_9EUKA|nr:MAG: hypothetical protein EZS28_033035 [Streblomastix strix]